MDDTKTTTSNESKTNLTQGDGSESSGKRASKSFKEASSMNLTNQEDVPVTKLQKDEELSSIERINIEINKGSGNRGQALREMDEAIDAVSENYCDENCI